MTYTHPNEPEELRFSIDNNVRILDRKAHGAQGIAAQLSVRAVFFTNQGPMGRTEEHQSAGSRELAAEAPARNVDIRGAPE